MCLVISVLLGILAANFFINGFYVQAFIAGLMALAFVYMLVKNLGCTSSCSITKKKEDKDDH